MGYTREEVCERDTNALSFKKAKQLINEKLFFKIGTYNPVGPRDDDYKEYQKMTFLKKNLEGITIEQVEEFSLVLAKLLKWLELAMDLRCENVVDRRDNKEYMK